MLGIYVHIPFCAVKCGYCDFVSTADLSLVPRYLDALKTEIGQTSRHRRDVVDTIFFGGGTPGILSAHDFGSLMRCIRDNFGVAEDAEITVETNPCAVTGDRLDAYLESGVNRLSMGMQAAGQRVLNLLNRAHTPYAFDKAYLAARGAGFENINIDIIYGVPTQTDKEWEYTLYHALYLKPEHISAYALKLEGGTPMGRAVTAQEIPEVNDDTAAEMYIFGRELLSQKGYSHYEVSNFSKIGSECKHNLKYWTLQDYIGLGAAAHSNVGNMRYANFSDINNYIGQMSTGVLQYESGEFIPPKERAKEAVMLLTRLKQGINARDFLETYDVNLKKDFRKNIEKAQSYGLIELPDDNTIAPTQKGFLFQNQLALMLTENM